MADADRHRMRLYQRIADCQRMEMEMDLKLEAQMAHRHRLFEDQSPLKDEEFNDWEPNCSPVNFMLQDLSPYESGSEDGMVPFKEFVMGVSVLMCLVGDEGSGSGLVWSRPIGGRVRCWKMVNQNQNQHGCLSDGFGRPCLGRPIATCLLPLAWIDIGKLCFSNELIAMSLPSREAYRRQLAEIFNMNRTWILAFKNKPLTPVELIPQSHSSTCSLHHCVFNLIIILILIVPTPEATLNAEAKNSERWTQIKSVSLAWNNHILTAGGMDGQGGSADQCIKFWNTHTGACLNSIDTGSQVSALLWNKNERELLSSHGFTQNQLTLWK
ncbi:hypothetical protein Dsin_028666 [Dipteronia sinensis]|uniref:Uncharacterized protein n=1 Tax=Dipteronia sinensis TaxID=43782 RepID=A0AAD9ZR09_9ROSI|nr:hypothetical protein Dsin_028666 [Dipteronia sinensis]